MRRRGEEGQEKGKGRGEEGEKSREGGSQRRGEWRRERVDAGKGGQERRERAERRGNEMKLVWKEGGIRKRISVLYGSVCTVRVHCVCWECAAYYHLEWRREQQRLFVRSAWGAERTYCRAVRAQE